MGYCNNIIKNLAVASLLFFGVLSVWLWPLFISNPLSLPQSLQCRSQNKTSMEVPKDELEEALMGASMGNNKTLIIAVVNKAYVVTENPEKTMLDLFLEGFWLGEGTRGLLDHLLIVAMDQTAYERCNFLRLHCYRLMTEGVDFGGEKLFLSEDFIKMMWRRTLFLGDVLKRGYNFIFTDTDIMWLRNPFMRLSQDESEDLQISCDKFNRNPWSHSNSINTGFYFIRSNNRTITLFESWYAMRLKIRKNMTEQEVLAKMKRDGIFTHLGMRVRFLDTIDFSGFCQDSRDFNVVTTVHSNCCRKISAKVNDLSVVLQDWKKFKVGSANHTLLPFQWTKHWACVNSWKS